MRKYVVTGMSCAACQTRVEKAVSQVPGVASCAVSLLTGSMGVEGEADPEAVIRAVTDAGYGATLEGASREASRTGAELEEVLRDRESPVLERRLIYSVGFLLVLMYLSMGRNMAHFPVPSFLEDPVSMAITQMLLAIVVMLMNHKFFISGYNSLWRRAPNMDTLVALGSSAAFAYSLAELYGMSAAQTAGDAMKLHVYAHNLYFETAAMIPCLITVGKLLEAKSRGRTTNALRSLMSLAPRTAVLLRDGREEEVEISQVRVGDLFVVRPGETIPVDGVVLEGASAVNEAALTGESIPVDKAEGNFLSAATINQSGYLKAKATRVGEDTTLRQIIRMVSDAAATKAPIARIADRVSAVFVPVVIGVAFLTWAVWLLAGQTFSFAIARAVAVLVISCPCALGLATPVAIMVGSGVGARHGILFKTAASQEEAGRIDIVALDKTGTITKGEPTVTDLCPLGDIGEHELLCVAASLEKPSEHPLARAVTARAREENIPLAPTQNFRVIPGKGVSAAIQGADFLAGNRVWMEESGVDLIDAGTLPEELARAGKTPLYFAQDGKLIGIIAIADAIREDSARAVRELRSMGIEVVMLTGDNEWTANAIGVRAGVDRIIAGVLPDGKEAAIRQLQPRGKVAMVGDGINDAPALTRADLGIAIGAGTDVAIDAADVVLMKSRLTDVSGAIRLSRATIRNIHQNLFWAFFYNLICIPLAAGFYQRLLGWNWEMSPMLGAAAMSLSSLTVCMNALRLNLVDIHNGSWDQKRIRRFIRQKKKEEPAMTKTVQIEGMMCQMCVRHVTEALNKLPGVTAEVSLENKSAIVIGDVADEVIKAAVAEAGYTVTGIA